MSESLVQRNQSTEKVSKAEVLNYVLETFERADADRDGSLDVDELRQFLQFLSHPHDSSAARKP